MCKSLLSLQLARQGLNVMIISRSEEKLQKVAEEISELPLLSSIHHSITVVILNLELSRSFMLPVYNTLPLVTPLPY